MKFEYHAKTDDGKNKEGIVEADSKGEALLKLQQKDLYVMRIDEKNISFYKKKVSFNVPFLDRVKDTDLVMFSRQLSIMLESQIGIIESLRILSQQIKNKKLKEKVKDIADRVEEGEPFSKALEVHNDVFSEFYIGAIESGEASGNLSQSLSYLEEHIERTSDFKKQLIGAMIYPLFIIFVFSFVVAFLMFYVIPDMVEMIQDMDTEIPAITQFVISLSNFFVNWGVATFFTIVAFFAALFRFAKTEKGKDIFDRLIFKIPIFGKFTKKIYITYFSESMATLISSGLDMVKSLEVTKNILSNNVYKEIVEETQQNVKEGKDISFSLQQYPKYFPNLVTQMIVVGEKTGEMEKILKSIVRFYQDQVDRSMQRYIKIAEPVLIILLGAVVGGLVISVLLPIYQVGMSL
ncbi:MAG: type II secretion system F family protein [Patescibacteria group bacterium]